MRRALRVARGARPGDDGAAAVEFALVLVMLLTLVFGIIQYGYYFFQSQAASSTVREASRLAAVGIDSCATFTRSVRAAALDNGLPAGAVWRVSVTFAGPGVRPARGDEAAVTLIYRPTKFGFPFLPFLSGNDTKKATTRVEDLGTLDRMSCP